MKRADPLAGVTAFLALAELKSFAATASRLKLSAATVSAQISDLESRLGMPLVVRNTRQITLTDAGEAYRMSLDGLVEQAERSSQIAAAFKDEIGGTIKIASFKGVTSWLLGTTIDKFVERYPNLSIDVRMTEDIVDLVANGYDIAVRGAHMVEPNWIVRKLKSSRVFLAASPVYLARRGAPRHPRDLAAHDCLQYSNLSFGNFWLLSNDLITERVPIQPRLLCNDGDTLREWGVAGLGVVLLPEHIIGTDIAEGRMVELLPSWQARGFDINIVYPDNRHITRKVKLFVDALIEDTRKLRERQ